MVAYQDLIWVLCTLAHLDLCWHNWCDLQMNFVQFQACHLQDNRMQVLILPLENLPLLERSIYDLTKTDYTTKHFSCSCWKRINLFKLYGPAFLHFVKTQIKIKEEVNTYCMVLKIFLINRLNLCQSNIQKVALIISINAIL